MVSKSGLERVFSQAGSVVVGCNFILFYSYRVFFFLIYQRYEVILQLAILSDECCTSRAVRNYIVINMPSQIQG